MQAGRQADLSTGWFPPPPERTLQANEARINEISNILEGVSSLNHGFLLLYDSINEKKQWIIALRIVYILA